jgi:hypothetical protein
MWKSNRLASEEANKRAFKKHVLLRLKFDRISAVEEKVWDVCQLTTQNLLRIAQQSNCTDCGITWFSIFINKVCLICATLHTKKKQMDI